MTQQNAKNDGTSDQVIRDLIKKALLLGADSADALLIDNASLSVGLRLGKIESLEFSQSSDLGLRVFVGQKQTIVSTTDRRPSTLDELANRAVAMARLAPEDPYCGLAAAENLASNWPSLDLADQTELTSDQLVANARAAEDSALAIQGVTNSEGAETGSSRSTIILATSRGFHGHYERTGYSLSAAILAGDGTGMERDYDYASRVFFKDMPSPESIGKTAGERAIRRLGARKMSTGKIPVVFEQRLAGGLISQLAGAISGTSVARGTSFLKDKLGQKIFADNVQIVDDPFRARGLRSRPFDAEGLAPQKRTIVDKGILTTWLLDLRSARQLGLSSTAHAVRSPGGMPSPSPSNLYMEKGAHSPEELMRDIKQGFFVTELMGMGVNGVTGDYSQAASGFWIEDGTIAFPVSEMTIAGNLKDMFLHLTPANDLEFSRGIDTPTLRIEGMTVAGL